MPRIAIALVAVSACATTRSPDAYRQDTHSLLESRSPRLVACYQKALEADPDLAGTFTIHFLVRKHTGELERPTIDPSSVPPQQLVYCVFDAFEGLRLDPPDSHDGQATFVYEFRRMPPST